MSFNRPYSQESLVRFFHTLIYLLVAIGFSMLVLAEQISPLVFCLFSLPFCGAFSTKISRKFQLTARQANLFTWLYLPLFLVDMLYLSRSFVPATLHLILFVQLIKIYQPKGNRDYFYLIILAFLQVLAASSLTINVSFFVCFLLFILVCIAALICFEMKRSMEVSAARSGDRCVGKENISPRQTELRFSLAEQSWAFRSIMAVSLVCLCAIAFLGTALFLAIPRFGAGYFNRVVTKPLSLSGFSDRIRLGSIGTIQLDPSVVMRVRVNGEPNLLKGMKWRGVTLDHFDGRNWSKRVRGSTLSYPYGHVFKIREPRPPGVLVSYQVLMEPSSTNYLFTLDRILTLRGNLHPVNYHVSDDSITAKTHHFGRLTYQAESALSPESDRPFRSADLPYEAKAAYLQLPSLDKRIFNFTNSVVFESRSLHEKAKRIEAYLQKTYSYSLEPSQLQEPQPLATFLFESKRGHCEYFASAMVVMLRIVGIPSRIVNGFQVGEYNTVGADYIIRGQDAHSWVEAYIPETGWQAFDPTPASNSTTPRHPFVTTIHNYLDAFELFWSEWILGYDEVTQISLFRDLQEKSTRWTNQSKRRFYQNAIEIQQGVLDGYHELTQLLKQGAWKFPVLSLLTVIGAWLAWRFQREIERKQLLKKAVLRGGGAVATQFYGEMLKFLRLQGKVKPQSLTPNEFVATFENPLVKREVEQLTEIYNAVRFSKNSVSENQIHQACQILSDLKNLSKKGEAIL